MPGKSTRKAAPAPFPQARTGGSKKLKNPLIERRPRNFTIGNDIQPQRNLSRFVKWPQYVQLQRQHKVLKMRLKVPPAIAQFSNTLDKNTAIQTFRLLNKYRPETKAQKQERLRVRATMISENKEVKDSKKPYFVKSGINHVTALIENKKATLVLIAADCEPIEWVIFLPALCRKMGIPYAFVRGGRARLGTVVHRKTAAVLAFAEVKSEDKNEFAKLVSTIKEGFLDKYEEHRRHWGGGVMGAKAKISYINNMTNIKQLNQSNPFWEWISEMEKSNQGSEDHERDNGEGPSQHEDPTMYEHHPGSFPPDHEDPPPPPPDFDDDKTPLGDHPEGPPSPPAGHRDLPGHHHHHPPGPGPHGPPRGGWRGRGGHHHGRSGPHGHHGPPGAGWGAWGGAGGPWGGPWGGRRGGWGGWGGRRGRGKWGQLFGMDGEGFNMEALASFMKDNFGIDVGQPKEADGDRDFKPPADVFDTPDAYIIHVSLAGAKKEDLAVNWDPENSEIHVSGIIHRPGDEEFLKTLALDERDIGVFERKIKLGTKAEPATVNADGISAKMEDGILMVHVPKKEEFVEIKKVDIL
ncbi:60S ribosomal protein L8B [Thelotrema lepadinum]|nr:60S ribosomal protein L8B [Thelotrema lepadinum]